MAQELGQGFECQLAQSFALGQQPFLKELPPTDNVPRTAACHTCES